MDAVADRLSMSTSKKKCSKVAKRKTLKTKPRKRVSRTRNADGMLVDRGATVETMDNGGEIETVAGETEAWEREREARERETEAWEHFTVESSLDGNAVTRAADALRGDVTDTDIEVSLGVKLNF